MDEPPDSLSQQLEAKISKLKDALHYWKTWEAEYEGLKEELDEQVEPTAQEMVGSTVQARYSLTVIGRLGRPVRWRCHR
jgi:hypothetical protein